MDLPTASQQSPLSPNSAATPKPSSMSANEKDVDVPASSSTASTTSIPALFPDETGDILSEPSGKYKYRDFSRVGEEDDDASPDHGSASANGNSSGRGNMETSIRVQKFPVKLYAILAQKEFHDIITWMPHGRSWKVLKPSLFESLVMPLFFEYSNYHSFNRLVNAWSFRRVSSGPDRGSYYHELFLRGKPHLQKYMRRLPKTQKKLPMKKEDEPDFYSLDKTHPLPALEEAPIPGVSGPGTLMGGMGGNGMNPGMMRGGNNNMMNNSKFGMQQQQHQQQHMHHNNHHSVITPPHPGAGGGMHPNQRFPGDSGGGMNGYAGGNGALYSPGGQDSLVGGGGGSYGGGPVGLVDDYDALPIDDRRNHSPGGFHHMQSGNGGGSGGFPRSMQQQMGPGGGGHLSPMQMPTPIRPMSGRNHQQSGLDFPGGMNGGEFNSFGGHHQHLDQLHHQQPQQHPQHQHHHHHSGGQNMMQPQMFDRHHSSQMNNPMNMMHPDGEFGAMMQGASSRI